MALSPIETLSQLTQSAAKPPCVTTNALVNEIKSYSHEHSRALRERVRPHARQHGRQLDMNIPAHYASELARALKTKYFARAPRGNIHEDNFGNYRISSFVTRHYFA